MATFTHGDICSLAGLNEKMIDKNIPTPVCSHCGEPGGKNYTAGETFYLCPNCGTEMKYRPAGELLTSGGSYAKKNNGWITTFSMFSTEIDSGRAMFGLGTLILLLAGTFLFLEKIGSEGALFCIFSGVLLIILGLRKTIRQKRKMENAMKRYPFWSKK